MKQLFIFLFFLPSVLFADIQCPNGYRLWNVFPDLGYKKIVFSRTGSCPTGYSVMTASPKKWFCNTDTNFPTGCNGASYSLDKTTLSDCASVAPDAVGETKCILTPPLCDFATFVCTSANVSNNLFADKNTSHAIAIKSGADTCYINLEPGQSSDAINIRMDGTVYHSIN
ncbi:MAG: hypothetical protein J6J82_01800 [Alphaproteobacteria bacterium]|nr:hypothetical protein [Alphaproteobacteria bacterium]